MLSYHANPSYDKYLNPATKSVIELNYAFELMRAGRFEDAYRQSKLMLEKVDAGKATYSIMFITNYIENNIHLESYQVGINTYYKYQDKLEKSHYRHLGRILTSYCHLFLNDADSALELLPDESLIRDTEVYLKRACYMIAFIVRNDLDLAETECTNLYKLVQTRKEDFNDKHHLSVKYFTRYIRLLRRHESLNSLTDSVKENWEEVKDAVQSNPPLIWLFQKLDIQRHS